MVKRILPLFFVGLLLFLGTSLGSFSPDEGPHTLQFPQTESFHNLCGTWGATCASFLFSGLGFAAYVLLIPLLVGTVAFWFNRSFDQIPLRIFGFGLILCAVSTFCALLLSEERSALVIGPGGYLGASLKHGLGKYFAAVGCYIFLASLLIAGLILTCEYTIVRIFLWAFGITPIGHTLVDKLKQTQKPETVALNPPQEKATVEPAKPQARQKPESQNPFAQKTKEKFIPPEFEAAPEPEPVWAPPEPKPEPSDELDDGIFEEQYGEEDYEEIEDEAYEPEPEVEYEEEEMEYAEEESDELTEPYEEEYYEEEEEPVEEESIEEEIEEPVAEDEPDEPQAEIVTESLPEPVPEKSGLFGWLKLGPSEPPPEETVEQESEPDEPSQEDAEAVEEESYGLPEVELLIPSAPFNYEVFESTVKKQAALLEKSFHDFGFNIRVVEIQTGPVIAQFEIQLERGLRLSKIQNLTDDLAIALKVPTVRIVAPIPGKNTVGVEIPNEDRQIVRLREVIEDTTEIAKNMQIPIFLGKDVSGTSMVVDLAKMPHLLIAGRTGTGKSVCLNSIIVSMLMTRTPEQVRMILIDPKMVELSPYKSIPHLMHPVVTDMRKAEAILGWAVEKMEERYQLLARAGVRQLSEYNNLSEEDLYNRMKPESLEEWESLPHSLPYMVIVADEMADLMMTAAKEVETHIIRLAQKSRAVGIHLVLATQKPTVDILTGLIKSNLPARIAFEVASRTDSLVVLDRVGAEKLLGNGDMLFLKPGTSQVHRGQGTYVSDKEIEAIIEQIGTEEQDFAAELFDLKIEGEEEDGDEIPRGRDAMYEKCVEFLIREGRGSLSLLQRRFSIGYNRAARIMDRMAAEGVVGPYNGSQAREVVLTLGDWRKVYEQRIAEAADGPRKQNPVNPTAIPRNKPSVRSAVVPRLEKVKIRRSVPFGKTATSIAGEDGAAFEDQE